MYECCNRVHRCETRNILMKSFPSSPPPLSVYNFYSWAQTAPMAVHHQSLISVWLFLLVMCFHCLQCSLAQFCSDLTLLERDLFQSGQNRYQLTKTFFPPRNAHPVFVIVNYTFEDSNTTKLWYWSESEFYLIQPLEIFQFSSLFFSNFPHRQASLSLTLSGYCRDASDEMMEVLTQRVS